MKTDVIKIIESAILGRMIRIGTKKPRRVLSVDSDWEELYEGSSESLSLKLYGKTQSHRLGLQEDFEILDES